jgi:hypothetical protein
VLIRSAEGCRALALRKGQVVPFAKYLSVPAACSRAAAVLTSRAVEGRCPPVGGAELCLGERERLCQFGGEPRDGIGIIGTGRPDLAPRTGHCPGSSLASQGCALRSPDSMAGAGSCQIAIAVFMRRKPSLP